MEHKFKYKLRKVTVRSNIGRLSEMPWNNPAFAPPSLN
jgi:hypothetical protein